MTTPEQNNFFYDPAKDNTGNWWESEECLTEEAKNCLHRFEYFCYETSGENVYLLEDFLRDIRNAGYSVEMPDMPNMPNIAAVNPLPPAELFAIVKERIKHLLTMDWGAEDEVEEDCNIGYFIEKHFGYNWEQDDDATWYFAKATKEEIWNYYETKILPKLASERGITY